MAQPCIAEGFTTVGEAAAAETTGARVIVEAVAIAITARQALPAVARRVDIPLANIENPPFLRAGTARV
jgi:hypothetical protein